MSDINLLLGEQKMYTGTQTDFAYDFRERTVSLKPFGVKAYIIKQYTEFGSEEWPDSNM